MAAGARAARAAAPGGRWACRSCGATALKWLGRCPACKEYGTVEEASPQARAARATRGPRPVVEVLAETTAPRLSTGVAELDRVLGGGLVPGQVVLLAGEPGVGKSTLLLAVAAAVASTGRTVLYASGEESPDQVGVRARRTGASAPTLLVSDDTDLEALVASVEQHDPALLVVDSVQTTSSAEVDGRPGGIAQVLEVTQALTRLAKSKGMPLLAIGQSTRENAVAGPRALEHLVDTVLAFEGDRHTPLRLLRSTKNRYGPADEVAAFEQVDTGLREVPDPSALFRSQREVPVAGTCVTVTLEGRRPMLAEVQALVAATTGPHPRRTVTGLDPSRVHMLAAVTERAGELRLADRDLYVATVGGARLSDPAADLALCLAVASAAWGTPVPIDVLAIGEVSLSGDIRPVGAVEQRVQEAARLGFRKVLVPRGAGGVGVERAGVTVVPVAHLEPALRALRRLAGEPR